MLSMESTSNRMSRLGKSLITDTELLSIERIIAEIDAVEPDALAELAGVLLAPERLSAAGIGPDEDRFLAAVERVNPAPSRQRRREGRPLRRGGKVGRVLGARARGGRPRAASTLGEAEAMRRLHRARRGRRQRARGPRGGRAVRRRHERLRTLAELDATARASAGSPCFVAPNFAIGAVLMMRFAAEAARYLPRAEIVELHNETKKDAPSGTARATAKLLGGEVPIHSVRLPGLVAHQEVLLRRRRPAADDPPRHVFARGVRAGRAARARASCETLPPGLTVGLEALLD